MMNPQSELDLSRRMVREIQWVGGDIPYPPMRTWAPISIEEVRRSWQDAADRADSEKQHFPGLYIHLPDQVLADAGRTQPFGRAGHYLDCLEVEAKQIAVPKSFSLRTVYVGGGGAGALSRFTAAQTERFFKMIRERFELNSCLQYSIELDLERTTSEHMRVLQDAGVHRVMALAVLPESAEQEAGYRGALERFVSLARRHRIGSVDVDQVCSARSLHGGAARRNLAFALGLGIDTIHLERGRGPELPEEEWRQCGLMLAEHHGAAPATDDHENLQLYHAKGLHGSVIGLGFGAVSHARTALRYLKAGDYVSYLLALGQSQPPSLLGFPLRRSDEMRGFVIRNLENVGRVSCDDFGLIFGAPLEQALPDELRFALDAGAVAMTGGWLAVPSSFRDHREVAAKFFYSREQRRMFGPA